MSLRVILPLWHPTGLAGVLPFLSKVCAMIEQPAAFSSLPEARLSPHRDFREGQVLAACGWWAHPHKVSTAGNFHTCVGLTAAPLTLGAPSAKGVDGICRGV
jgi:hypothetical protein